MTGHKKKIAAALAAVSLYLQQEEAMVAQEQAPLMKPQRCEFSQWGQSGRQEMMAMRKLIQLRTFTRF